MSHFTVAVITNEPGRRAVAAALAPYHEFECTGRDDQYVVEQDITEEVMEEYKSNTRSMVKLPDGSLLSAYEDQFYRDPTPEESKKIGPIAGTGCGGGLQWSSRDWSDGLGYRTKVKYLPEGCEEVQVPYAENMSFRDFVEHWYGEKPVLNNETPNLTGEHKYGYMLIDSNGVATKVVRRTNPNAKWDWYAIGGRWTGQLVSKSGVGLTGEPGLMTEPAPVGTRDQCQIKDLDLEAMAEAAGARAAERWHQATTKHVDMSAELREMVYGIEVNDTCETYVQRAKECPFSTFACLDEDGWHEKGNMGWWGATSDENPNWQEQFNNWFKNLVENHGDKYITVVDCHI